MEAKLKGEKKEAKMQLSRVGWISLFPMKPHLYEHPKRRSYSTLLASYILSVRPSVRVPPPPPYGPLLRLGREITAASSKNGTLLNLQARRAVQTRAKRLQAFAPKSGETRRGHTPARPRETQRASKRLTQQRA